MATAAEKKQEVVTQENTQTQVATPSRNKVTDFSLGIFGTSDNFIMANQMAKALAQSTIVPQMYQKNEANCLIAIELAQRLRTSPIMVMQNLDVIQGRPAWRAKYLIATINNSKKYDTDLQYEEKQDKEGKPFSCKCWVEKGGRRIEGMTVDMDMARAEGWLGKNGSKWKTMPQLMLRYRAASFFSSLNCPELTLGIYTKEEIIDGDFKEYPMEDLQTQVQQDIQQNANSELFEPEIAETVEEPKAAEPQKAEGEAVEDANLPDFMK